MIPTPESLHRAFATALDSEASVRVRRPGRLFQVDLPAYMGDGDAAEIYVRPGRAEGSLVVTDLGSTRTRISYRREVDESVDAELARLAEPHGIELLDGELQVEVPANELFAATLGLLQVEAQAEQLAYVSRRRAREATQFRKQVLELLHELFREDQIEAPFFDEKNDEEALYKIDALIRGKKPLGVAIVPGDLEAERAVGSKLVLEKTLIPDARWLAIPRDLERLGSRTRKRLLKHYYPAGSSFERDVVRKCLRDLADVA